MLAAGTGWESFDFWGCIFLNFNGVLPGNEMVNFFFFWGGGGGGIWGGGEVTHNLSFTKIICISMPID